MRIIQASTDDQIQEARLLFKEYEANIGVSLCFQNFDRELANLPGDYAPPPGRLLLAVENDNIAGCIALRKLGPQLCEMKRLFVRPEYRGTGLGRVLVEKIVDEARQLGYAHMRLDTMPGKMDKAITLYRSVGFVEIPPYCENPVADAKFMELDLQSQKGTKDTSQASNDDT